MDHHQHHRPPPSTTAININLPIHSMASTQLKSNNMKHHHHLPFAALLIILTLLFISSFSASAIESPAAAPSPSGFGFGIGCDGKCAYRCSRSGWKDRCLKYCGICCGKCKGCVPSGPYADKAQCPCYRDLKNPKGRDKCP